MSEIKNSEIYKGGFFDVPIQPQNLGSVRRESEFESFHKNSMNEQSMVSGPQILKQNQNIKKGDGIIGGIDQYSVDFDQITKNQNFHAIDSTSAQLPSRALDLAQEIKTDTQIQNEEENNPVQLMIIHKDKFPHCLSEIGLNNHNEGGNFENLALQQFGGCGSVQECQTQQMKGGNNMMLIDSSSWTFNKDMQLQENASSQLNQTSNKKDFAPSNVNDAAQIYGLPTFTEKTLSINIMNSQFSLEDIDQSPAKILNASDQNLIPKAAVDQQQQQYKIQDYNKQISTKLEDEKEPQKNDSSFAKLKLNKLLNKNQKGSFISNQSISSKRNIFKMMLKQDNDEEPVNVDDDEICDGIQDDEMNFQDNKQDKSFNSNESNSP